jgi:D-3-phosphoglycerate dehydrogenase/C-terminal binding protein
MSPRYKVVVTDLVADDLAPEKAVLGDVAGVVALDSSGEDDLAGRIEDADAIILYHKIALTCKTIERLEHCKLIVRNGVGYDNVDHLAARARGIPVANVPDYGNEEVADSALGLMLALARGIAQGNSLMRDGAEPWSYIQVAPLCRLRGRGFGVVGLGRIGTAAALRAKALGMDVVFYDPYKPCGYDKALGIRRAEQFDALLAQSHVLSLHCPLTEETFHMINRRTIAKLPRGAYLINTARGGVVDAAALPEALVSGQLSGVGIDVLEREPPPAGDPLLAAWRDPRHPAYHRLLLNPHTAFYSEEGVLELRAKGADACRRALCGQPIPNVVN